MTLTDAENNRLQRLWTRAKPFHSSCGHGLVWLVPNDDNAWAIAKVREWRNAASTGEPKS